MKTKADRLLKYITDKKDRYDPPIPSDLPASTVCSRPKVNGTNGYLNGSLSRTRSPSIIDSPSHVSGTTSKIRTDVAFPDSPAVVRTPDGMAMFASLDKEAGSSQPKGTTAHRLRQMAPTVEFEAEDEDSTMLDAPTGVKRKL